jgi:outer membrane protein OmpA-like peptidoglycan-associated protein
MKRTVLSATIALSFAGAAAGQPVATAPEANPSDAVVPITYVGGNARIGLGIDDEGDLLGELLGVFGYDGTRAFLAEGWLGQGSAGGAKISYNWLWGGKTVEDTINAPDGVLVTKAFLAADQNTFEDRKATLGFGLERRNTSLDFYYSRALTDERLVSSDLQTRIETITGVENGRPYTQQITIDTLTELFEHPYEDGVGLRVGHFFEDALLRVRGGLDYERGDAFLDDDDASQVGVSAGIEKFFSGSGHSLALDVGHYRKSGPFDRSEFGGERDDTRASLLWRYDFGTPFRAVQPMRDIEVSREVVEPAPVAAPQAMRNEVQLSGEALFGFDSADLTAAAQAELAPLVAALRGNSVGSVDIVGHTCDIGAEAYNQGLSERRAAAVRDWLVGQGVDAGVLQARGQGEGAPRFANDSPENRSRNRRVELSFVTIEESTAPPPPPVTRTITEWQREPIPTPPAWIERALRNPPAHKRAVDTYRIEQVSETRTEGPREFINQPPDAVDDSASTAPGTPVTISVLANDTDPDGDALTEVATRTPANGTVAINAGGTVTYTPAAGFVGTDTFTYTITDPDGLTDTATVSVAVQQPGNLPPVANPDSASTTVGTPVTIDVLANDTDPEGDALTLVSASQPANGSTTVTGNGRVQYTPNPGFIGTDTFSYVVRDAAGNSATGQVTVTVAEGAPNQAPVALPDSASVLKRFSVDINVLGNDSDPDGDALTVTRIFYDNDWAVITINPDGTIRYAHQPGTSGFDTFQYEVSDGRGGFARATVTVQVIFIP